MSAAFSDPPMYRWAELPEPLRGPKRLEDGCRGSGRCRAERLSQRRRIRTATTHSYGEQSIMKTIAVQAIKVTLPFRTGELPKVPWQDPVFELSLGGLKIECRITAKAARKLSIHSGPALLQGRLVMEGGRLVLLQAGFVFVDLKPAEVAALPTAAASVAAVPAGPGHTALPLAGLAGRVLARSGRAEREG